MPQYLTLNPVNVPSPAYQPQQQNIQPQWPAPSVPSAPIAAPAPPPPAAFSAPQPAPTYQSQQQNVQPQWSAQAPAIPFVAQTPGTNGHAGASLPVNIAPSPTSQFPSPTSTAQNGAVSGVSESATAGVQGNSAAVLSR